MAGFGQPLQLVEMARPEPAPGQILIKLQASGVCHSDVHIWKGESRPDVAPDPFILGHEGVGLVAAIGPAVTGWAIGERAGAAWLHDTCGVCELCLVGTNPFVQVSARMAFMCQGPSLNMLWRRRILR